MSACGRAALPPRHRRLRRGRRRPCGGPRRHGRPARRPPARFIQAIFESHHSVRRRPAAWAVQLALIGRYYERIGDHAVNIGERVQYMVTGWLPEHAGAARAAARVEARPTPRRRSTSRTTGSRTARQTGAERAPTDGRRRRLATLAAVALAVVTASPSSTAAGPAPASMPSPRASTARPTTWPSRPHRRRGRQRRLRATDTTAAAEEPDPAAALHDAGPAAGLTRLARADRPPRRAGGPGGRPARPQPACPRRHPPGGGDLRPHRQRDRPQPGGERLGRGPPRRGARARWPSTRCSPPRRRPPRPAHHRAARPAEPHRRPVGHAGGRRRGGGDRGRDRAPPPRRHAAGLRRQHQPRAGTPVGALGAAGRDAAHRTSGRRARSPSCSGWPSACYPRPSAWAAPSTTCSSSAASRPGEPPRREPGARAPTWSPRPSTAPQPAAEHRDVTVRRSSRPTPTPPPAATAASSCRPWPTWSTTR